MPPPQLLGILFGGSEALLTLGKRSGKNAVSKDRRSLALIWAVNLGAIAAGVWAAHHWWDCRLPGRPVPLYAGYALFLAGLVLRWAAIIHLGRFFTTNVAIARDHRVIDTGPYRLIRHPSYTGALLALAGFCLSFQNWASALIIFIPCLAVNAWRIHVEEQALLEGLGEEYRRYMARTKRLIPYVF